MAEKYSKSKLKRNKVSVKELQPEISSGGTARRSPAFPETALRRREERLWAMALKSALQEDQLWDLPPPLPPLPPPSAAPDGWRSSGGVTSVERCPPSLDPPPPPLSGSSSSQCCPLTAGPVNPPPNNKAPPAQLEELPSPTTPSGDGGDRWRKEGDTGALNREQGGARRKGSLQRVEEHKEEGVQRTVGAAAGGGGCTDVPCACWSSLWAPQMGVTATWPAVCLRSRGHELVRGQEHTHTHTTHTLTQDQMVH
ncbi:hypothetical protein F7725_000175 [Dissostichus mawsoni]|uniref:Uncharacterized protein n=1 Tax=Dissostichus mawsoni TaxID=36200 RepID=A0A7J5ZE90_DISMA|nr:hypothetical protein F7725_000175 [Dissostichus mawsoni]